MALKDYNINLAANQVLPLQITGTYIRCIALNVASIKIRLTARNTQGGQSASSNMGVEFTTFALGLGIGPLPQAFDTIEFTDALGGGLTGTFTIGDTPVEDNRLVGVVNITGGIASKVYNGGDTLVSKGTVSLTTATATQLWAATLQPGYGVLYNEDATNTVYLGVDNTVTNTTGIPLIAGATVDNWPCGIAAWGYQNSGGTTHIRKIQLKWA